MMKWTKTFGATVTIAVIATVFLSMQTAADGDLLAQQTQPPAAESAPTPPTVSPVTPTQVTPTPESPAVAEPKDKSGGERTTALRKKIEQTLLETATFQLQHATTDTIARSLRNQTGLPFVTDLRGLEVAGQVVPNPKFNYDLEGLPLQVALREVLRPAALRADVRDDSIVITVDTAELARRGVGAS